MFGLYQLINIVVMAIITHANTRVGVADDTAGVADERVDDAGAGDEVPGKRGPWRATRETWVKENP